MQIPVINFALPGSAGLWMLIFFAVFIVSIILLVMESRSVKAKRISGTVAPPVPPMDKKLMEEIVDKRFKQLDEKLIDIHARTAAKLEQAAREVEERMTRMKKDFEDMTSGKGIQERFEQLDEKLVDLHTKASKRIAEIIGDLEQRVDEFKEEVAALVLEKLREKEGGEPPAEETEPPLKL